MKSEPKYANRVGDYLKKLAPNEEMRERLSVRAGVHFESGRLEGVDTRDDEVASVLKKLRAGQQLSVPEAKTVEAIILPRERPVVAIQDDTFLIEDPLWSHLSKAGPRKRIEAAIPSIGRLELPGNPQLPYAGTAFVVGDGLLMTNRHVAELFCDGLGRDVRIKPRQRAEIDFKRELGGGRDDTRTLQVQSVLYIHTYWDMALLKVRDLPSDIEPLALSVGHPDDLRQREVVVIGYPARDWRNDSEVQDRIFGGVYYVKRLQPGKIRERKSVESYDNVVSAMTHDCSTLGGNSGSCVLDVETGEVLGLHFAGEYLKDNYAVSGHDLRQDTELEDFGVRFKGSFSPPERSPHVTHLNGARHRHNLPTSQPVSVSRQEGNMTMTFNIPMTITVSMQPPTFGDQGAAGVGLVEKIPVIYPDLETRKGYDQSFLGSVKVPLPVVTEKGLKVVSTLEDGSHHLHYHKFSLVLHKKRRLALFTAANVDWTQERFTRDELNGHDDTETWVTDPRIPFNHQLPDVFYTKDKGAFDRGHLVRRDDVAWGESFEDAQMSNGDTFHTTNCSPQVAKFNQSSKGVDNWGDLENMIQKQTGAERVCVFSGPVFRESDLFFDGLIKSGVPVAIQIPTSYWKIVVAKKGNKAQAFGFVLDQNLARVPLRELAIPDAWKRFLKPIAEIEKLCGGLLDLGFFKKNDQEGL